MVGPEPWPAQGPAALPEVSVVIPTYNASRSIEAAIRSVAQQAYPNLEVILVDDASTDDTAARAEQALQRYGLRHTVVRSPRNQGPATARNTAVRLAQGEYVAFLDADDEWLPGKLVRQVKLMETHRNVTLCGCQAIWIDEVGETIEPLFQDLPTLIPDGWKLLLSNCFVATPCVLARRDDLGTQPFDPSMPVGEDRDLWIKLASNGVVGLVQDVLVLIRRSRSSFMAQHTHLVDRYTKPMIERHMRSFSDSLSFRQVLRARGLLHSQMGKILTAAPKHFLSGGRHLLLAALLGYRPWDNLRQLVYAAPVARHIKAYIKWAIQKTVASAAKRDGPAI